MRYPVDLMNRRTFALISAGAVLSACSAERHDRAFAPQSPKWAVWAQSDPSSRTEINHRPWDMLLQSYVRTRPDGVTLFAYGEVSSAHQTDLDDYIRDLTAVPVATLNRAEQYAFWINLYNALTIRVVLTHYIVSSIADINLGTALIGQGPWRQPLVSVGGIPLSLDDIENRILRAYFNDPRMHYGLCRATLGGPNLQPFAFTGRNIDSILEDAASRFVNHGRAIRFDRPGHMTINSLYHWYQSDFGGFQGVLAHLRHYAEPGLRREIGARFEKIDYRYDWALNDATGLRLS